MWAGFGLLLIVCFVSIGAAWIVVEVKEWLAKIRKEK